MPESNDNELLQKIQEAFTNLPYPGDENLVYDNTDFYSDVVKTKQSFLGKHWKELSIDTINRHRDNLPQFTAEAFCFYLPAFMMASIIYPITLIDVLPENLIFSLIPRDRIEGVDTKLNTIIRILTLQQKRVVVDFLEWYTKKYVLDVPGYPEELKDLKQYHTALYEATNFWQNVISSESPNEAST